MAKVRGILTQEYLKTLLVYNKDTGIFINKKTRGPNARIGCPAGCLHNDSYFYIILGPKTYLAHRLAWLYEYGYFPENEIDHIDRVPHHNWINNLREVTHQCNIRNSKMNKNNKSGITGVLHKVKTGKWIVTATVNLKQIYIGTYKTKLDAAKARWNAEVEYGYPNCNTTSSAYLYINKNK